MNLEFFSAKEDDTLFQITQTGTGSAESLLNPCVLAKWATVLP